MEELATEIAKLLIMLCGLSLIVSVLIGKKPDFFLLVRPIGRFFGRLIRGSYKFSKHSTRSAYGIARSSRRPAWQRVLAGIFAMIFTIGAIVLWLPAELFGSGNK